MARERLRVDMDMILEALREYGDDASAYLDRETGEVVWWHDLEDSDVPPGFDPDDPRYAEIPCSETHVAYREMERFASEVDERDVREQLAIALSGKGAFRRFRDVLAGFPDLQARWRVQENECRLREALAWLDGIGIEPEYELRHVPAAPRLGTTSPKKSAVDAVTLADLLLLGAPEGRTEILDGKVRREYLAPERDLARRVFRNIAREIVETSGLAWRKRFVEGRDAFEMNRFHLSVAGRVVTLDVEVPPETGKAFSG